MDNTYNFIKEKLPNHIEEYLQNTQENNVGLPLFNAKEEDIDFKTDLKIEEILNINALNLVNKFIITSGLNDIYGEFINKVLRLKVSQDRKSRLEYTEVHKKNRFGDELNQMASFKTILDTKN